LIVWRKPIAAGAVLVFLGQMLGVRRTTVTVAASLLQSTGLIRYHRGHIQIFDPAALEDISCECYAVIQQNVDKVFLVHPRVRASSILARASPAK
jgi:hypothetical protein